MLKPTAFITNDAGQACDAMLDRIPVDLIGNTLLIQALIDQAGYTVATQRKVAEFLGLLPFTKES